MGAAKILLRGFEGTGTEGGCATEDNAGFATEEVERGALGRTNFVMAVDERERTVMGLRFGRGAKLKRLSLGLGTGILRFLSKTLSTAKQTLL